MVWQVAEPEYKAKKISDYRVGGRITDPRFPDYIPQRMRIMARFSTRYQRGGAIVEKTLFGSFPPDIAFVFSIRQKKHIILYQAFSAL